MGQPVPCSVCHAANHKRCTCPWSLAFHEWPLDLLKKVQQQIKLAGRP